MPEETHMPEDEQCLRGRHLRGGQKGARRRRSTGSSHRSGCSGARAGAERERGAALENLVQRDLAAWAAALEVDEGCGLVARVCDSWRCEAPGGKRSARFNDGLIVSGGGCGWLPATGCRHSQACRG